jgi:glycolate oxidase iron-sulfur subunit
LIRIGAKLVNSLHPSRLQTTLAHEEQKLLACIHCGLCLEACPTYVITGNENDGPRGRLYLMRAVAEGRLANTSSAFSQHIDRCLGCRACEQVCPAGVEYGQLLEASRQELLIAQPKQTVTHKLLRLALRHLWLSTSRLRMFFGATRLFRDVGLARLLLKSRLVSLVSDRAHFALALLDSSRASMPTSGIGPGFSRERKGDPARPAVMLFQGCVGEGLFARVNRATERVLQVNGFAVTTPGHQVCCGALHAHAGDLTGARILARKNITAFADAEATPVITNAGGCGAMLASYGHLLADENNAEEARHFSARVRDVSQQLEATTVRRGAPVEAKGITYDMSCHLLYGQHAGESSLKLLRTIPDLKFTSLEGAERCCGGAGIYNLLEPQMSAQVLEEKLKHVHETGAQVLATGNPGCQMQIGGGACLSGMKLEVCHPVELLDESYARAGFYEEREADHRATEKS